MGIKYIDAKRLRRILISGAKWVKKHEDYLNELNVYPVPDGDTGSNMSMTLETMKNDLENDTTKKEAIQADLNRLMKLFTAYKAYNKKAATAINNDLATMTKHIGKVIDAYNKAIKGTVTVKKTTTDEVDTKDLTDTSKHEGK